MKYFATLILATVVFCTNAQIGFQRAGQRLVDDFQSGCAVVCIDVNGDAKDDLVRLDGAIDLHVDVQLENGDFAPYFNEQVANNPEWNLVAGDVDNDGWVDIVTSGVSDRVKVVRATPFSSEFNVGIIDDERFFAQCSNLADVDNNGFLDIFVCNDNGLNRLYMNDGNGAFSRDDEVIDFRTAIPSDNSGNYGSTWSDFDFDGDLDLYISKCRQGVFEPTDPRRINVLYEQTDTGYAETAADWGLDIGLQSWSADFADYDNDGDFDLIVINHDLPSQLFENIENDTFVEVTQSAGISVEGIIIQSIFRDFDNDGYLDLFVSGSASKLYRNNGDGTFELLTEVFDEQNVVSFTIGDLNTDGFPDVYLTFNELYNTPSNKDDQIWLNIPNGNNYLAVKAVGTTSNASAVGAKMLLYGDWGVQLREVRAGESYGIGTSLIQNFGLGASDAVDSLVVLWPSGQRDVHEDFDINQTIIVEEGMCATPLVDLGIDLLERCSDDAPAEVAAPDGYEEYLWSNGATTRQVSITEGGNYHVSLTDENGCLSVSSAVSIVTVEEPDTTFIEVIDSDIRCKGETIALAAPEGVSFEWSDGQTSDTIRVSESGEYAVTVTRVCSDAVPEPVSVTFVDPTELTTENDTVLGGGEGILFADGDRVNWYAARSGGESIGEGNTFETGYSDTTITFFAEQVQFVEGDRAVAGMTEHMGTLYSPATFNGGISFDVLEACTLDSFAVETDLPGPRTIIIQNSDGDVIESRRVELDTGRQVLHVDIALREGSDYFITTSVDSNQSVFGMNSPQLTRSDEGVDYPYVTEEFVSLTGAPFGASFYYYFFDWHLSKPGFECTGERNPVQLVVVDTSVSTRIPEHLAMEIFPNPASQRVFVRPGEDFGGSPQVEYSVSDLSGRRVLKGFLSPDGQYLNTAGLGEGMYFVELRNGALTGVGRFIVQRN